MANVVSSLVRTSARWARTAGEAVTLGLVKRFFPVAYNRYGYSGLVNGTRALRNPTRQLQALTESYAFAVGVLRLSFAVAATPWAVETEDGEQVESGAVVDLLKNLNPLTNWSDFAAKLVMHLLACGNGYILKDPISQRGTPMELWLRRPDRTRPMVLKPGEVSYEHDTDDGRRFIFNSDQIEHVKLPNPFSDLVGMGLLTFMETEIDIDAAAAEYNRLYFENGASLGTMLETDQKMDPEKAKEILEGFKAMYRGASRAHKTALFDNGLKAKPFSTSPKESDYVQTRKEAGDAVGGLMGVPPIQRGRVENANRSNSVTQDIIFLRDGVKPLLGPIAESMTYIVKTFDKRWVFKFHPAVVEGDDTKATIFAGAFDRGAVSPNDIRVHVLGLKPVADNPAMDMHYLGLNMLPLETVDQVQKRVKALEKAQRLRARGFADSATENFKAALVSLQAKGVTVRAEGDPSEFPEGTTAQRRILQFLAGNKISTERRMRAGVKRGFTAQGDAYVAAWMKGRKDAGDVEAGSGIPTIDVALTPVITEELKHQYKLLADLFSLDTEFTAGQSRFALAKGRLAQRLVAVDQATKDEIEAVIRDGMERGLSTYEIANGTTDGEYPGIRGTFDEFSKERAQLIARTEGGALQDQAAMAAYDDMGVEIVDVLGCADFVKMSGQTYGCNSQNIPLAIIMASPIEFHPNHNGGIVPRPPMKAAHFEALKKLLQPVNII